ncbi:DMT family transporter [Poseidonocella sp. HB161398]|uniref:DMT family transporter n=1 Tax=Poseidonocella sp. HB161398 TaxID=2320855 RepID=UPI001107F1DB|nr:DMT family transporter [Poseidonocella sp. HB161398]
MKKPVDAAALSAMLVLCLVWGMQQVSMKAVAGAMEPVLQIGLRSAVAALLVWGWSRWRGRDRWVPGVLAGPGLAAGGLFALEFLLVAAALERTSAAHVSVFLYTAPVFAAIGLHLAQPEERLRPVQWTGVAVAFAGVAAVFLLPGEGGAPGLTAQMLAGDLLALGAGLAWGMTTVVIRTTRLAEAPPAQTLSCQLGIAGAAALAFAWATGRTGVAPGGLLWASLSFQTLVVCALSFLAWFRLLQIYPSSRLGILSLMTPLFGVALGALLLGEPLSPGFLAGGTLVLAGMGIVQGHEMLLQRRRRAEACRAAQA